MDLRDPVARMLNTCLIGRRWKPREGWSRPVLTGDGDITFRSSCGVGSASFLCWIVLDGNMRWDGHEYDSNGRLCLASASRFPNRHVIIEWPEWPPCFGCRSVIAVLRWS